MLCDDEYCGYKSKQTKNKNQLKLIKPPLPLTKYGLVDISTSLHIGWLLLLHRINMIIGAVTNIVP